MNLKQIFGGNPLAVVIRLVLISIVVGIVLSAFGITPDNIVYRLQLFITRLYNLGFDALGSVFDYLLLGAVVVIPIWLLTRILSGLGGRSRDTDAGDKV